MNNSIRFNGLGSIVFVVVACFMLLLSSGTASADDKERIDGVAQFLLDRANANSRYVFEKKLKSNEALKLYLPTVYSYLEDYGLSAILQSKPGMWKRAVENDLDDLLHRYNDILKQKSALYIINELDKMIGDMPYTVNGVKCSLETRYTTASPCLNIQVEIAHEYGLILNELLDTLESASSLESMKKGFESSLNKFNVLISNESYGISSIDEKSNKVGELKSIWSGFELRDLKVANEIARLIKEYGQPNITTSEKVDISLKVIAIMVENYKKDIFSDNDAYEAHVQYFERYRAYAFMFAQIADAENAENVQAILTAYTLPPVSFGVKREEGVHLTISSYLGVAGGAEFSDADSLSSENRDEFVRLIAPIGFEYSLGSKNKYSYSLFISVVDFGAAVSAQVSGSEHDLEFEDLFAPGIFGVFGLKDWPLAIGVGYQKTRALNNGGEDVHNVLVFAAFDMPLLVLY
ncbi:MAG: hypothetical protein KAR83_08690 [Thermodesulfovibrionales bacterium]|nr:hypothetical protein [Thermodesulfovibrionales bacterium]